TTAVHALPFQNEPPDGPVRVFAHVRPSCKTAPAGNLRLRASAAARGAVACARGKVSIAEMPAGESPLRLRVELVHERGKTRRHRGGEGVVLGLERAPERREPRAPIASECRPKRPLKARRATGRLRRCA